MLRVGYEAQARRRRAHVCCSQNGNRSISLAPALLYHLYSLNADLLVKRTIGERLSPKGFESELYELKSDKTMVSPLNPTPTNSSHIQEFGIDVVTDCWRRHSA
jgi:hypothetical protein